METQEIVEMLEVLARAQDELFKVRQETGIDELEESIASMKKTIGAKVLEHGAPVKGSVLQAIINKGRVSWDGKKLEGMMALIPGLEAARKEGEPTVTIRGLK
jgi:hypothetical protein